MFIGVIVLFINIEWLDAHKHALYYILDSDRILWVSISTLISLTDIVRWWLEFKFICLTSNLLFILLGFFCKTNQMAVFLDPIRLCNFFTYRSSHN